MKKIITILTLTIANLTFAAPEAILMTTEPGGFKEFPRCERVKYMTILDETSSFITIQLKNAKLGTCDLLVPGMVRNIELKFVGNNCGSKIYRTELDDGTLVYLQDNATRICEDYRPSRFELEIADSAGKQEQLYSSESSLN